MPLGSPRRMAESSHDRRKCRYNNDKASQVMHRSNEIIDSAISWCCGTLNQVDGECLGVRVVQGTGIGWTMAAGTCSLVLPRPASHPMHSVARQQSFFGKRHGISRADAGRWEMGFEVRSKQPDSCSHSSQTCIGPAGALPIQVKTSSSPLPQARPLLPSPISSAHVASMRRGARHHGGCVTEGPKESIFLLTHVRYIP